MLSSIKKILIGGLSGAFGIVLSAFILSDTFKEFSLLALKWLWNGFQFLMCFQLRVWWVIVGLLSFALAIYSIKKLKELNLLKIATSFLGKFKSNRPNVYDGIKRAQEKIEQRQLTKRNNN